MFLLCFPVSISGCHSFHSAPFSSWPSEKEPHQGDFQPPLHPTHNPLRITYFYTGTGRAQECRTLQATKDRKLEMMALTQCHRSHLLSARSFLSVGDVRAALASLFRPADFHVFQERAERKSFGLRVIVVMRHLMQTVKRCLETVITWCVVGPK